MSRPVLYLDTFAALAGARVRQEMPSDGQVISAMCVPVRSTIRGTRPGIPRTSPCVHTQRSHLGEYRAGQIDSTEYLRRYALDLAGRGKDLRGFLTPGMFEHCAAQAFHLQPGKAQMDLRRVQDGDALVCMCPRSKSHSRKADRWCHLEELAWWLVDSGWDVRLYGELLTMNEHGAVVRAETGLPYEGPTLMPEDRRRFQGPRLGESTVVEMPGDGRTRIQNYRSTR